MRVRSIAVLVAMGALQAMWWLGAEGLVAKVAGSAFIGLACGVFAAPRLAKRYWVELLALCGVAMVAMVPGSILLGCLLLSPLIMTVAMFGWRSLQGQVVTKGT